MSQAARYAHLSPTHRRSVVVRIAVIITESEDRRMSQESLLTLEVIIKRLSTDHTSHSLRSVLSPKGDGLSGFVVPFVRNWKDQLFVLPCDLPRLEFARSNLKTREISFMQTEEIRLYHFSECVSLIFGDVLVYQSPMNAAASLLSKRPRTTSPSSCRRAWRCRCLNGSGSPRDCRTAA